MSFDTIFKKGFLSSYANTETTFKWSLITLSVCACISIIICIIYYFRSRKYFYSKEFALSLFALSIITNAVILTIQSSIVISLGMVGALSIVRFRTAIKNPLDLVFLFWAICNGIICGAGIFYLSIIISIILGIFLLVFDEIPSPHKNNILVLNGAYPYKKEELYQILGTHLLWYETRTETITNDEVALVLEIRGKDIDGLLNELAKTGMFHNISTMRQEGIIE